MTAGKSGECRFVVGVAVVGGGERARLPAQGVDVAPHSTAACGGGRPVHHVLMVSAPGFRRVRSR
jgi:hypothetical protein